MFQDFESLRDHLCTLVDNPACVTMVADFDELTNAYLTSAGWEPRISSDESWDDVHAVLKHTFARLVEK